MKTLASLLLCAALPLTLAAAEPAKDSAIRDDEALVQVAILLDTSNSMDGLIEQAKTQLWKIVNEFNGAKRAGKTPVVQVALYEYGNSRLSAGTNYVRQVLPFTRDLDSVSEQLFKLTTSGGDEYCGAVIREALDNLAWDTRPGTYKTVFIAGNEPFTQGPVSANESCRAANRQGVIVNTIHCGSQSEGENGGWRTGAALAEGKFLTIDQDKAVVHIDAPQDKEITRLSIEINKTYIQFGKDGKRGADNQAAQDKNAMASAPAGSHVQRSLTKSSANYDNTGWDLVDANKKAGVKLEAVSEADLPAEMKNMTPAERQAYVDTKATERAQIQRQIQKLNEERQAYIREKAKAQGQEQTLDNAIAKAVREQASKMQFEFGGK